MLAGVAQGETGSTGGGGPVRLSDVDTWELVDTPFHVGGGHGQGIREFMNNADRPAFLERKLVGLGMDVYL